MCLKKHKCPFLAVPVCISSMPFQGAERTEPVLSCLRHDPPSAQPSHPCLLRDKVTDSVRWPTLSTLRSWNRFSVCLMWKSWQCPITFCLKHAGEQIADMEALEFKAEEVCLQSTRMWNFPHGIKMASPDKFLELAKVILKLTSCCTCEGLSHPGQHRVTPQQKRI